MLTTVLRRNAPHPRRGTCRDHGLSSPLPTAWTAAPTCYRDWSQPGWLTTNYNHMPPKSKASAVTGCMGRSLPGQANAHGVPKTRATLAQIRKAKNTPPILTVKSSATMQFRAARSLWTNLLALRYAMPSAISPAIWIILLRLGGARTGLFCWRIKKKKKKKDTRENLGIFPTPRSFRVCRSSFVQPEHPKSFCEETRSGSEGGRGTAL